MKRKTPTYPDWLKPGNWVYDKVKQKYGLLICFNKKNKRAKLYNKEVSVPLEDLREAYIKPWNFAQAPFAVKVYAVRKFVKGTLVPEVLYLTTSEKQPLYVSLDGAVELSAEALARNYVDSDGFPLGTPSEVPYDV